MLREVEKITSPSLNVLISGVNGAGKENLAGFIHQNSKGCLQPFIKVNCASIPVNLFESEFFGPKKGVFTGAIRDKKGKFKMSNRGANFLDKIGELSPDFTNQFTAGVGKPGILSCWK